MASPRNAQTVEYQMDDGNWAFALVSADNGDKWNLSYQDPSDGSWGIATDVPKNSDRVR